MVRRNILFANALAEVMGDDRQLHPEHEVLGHARVIALWPFAGEPSLRHDDLEPPPLPGCTRSGYRAAGTAWSSCGPHPAGQYWPAISRYIVTAAGLPQVKMNSDLA